MNQGWIAAHTPLSDQSNAAFCAKSTFLRNFNDDF
jgi:hypothetical protein